jgi:hypothetical protein
VSAEQVALISQCAECGKVWLPADGDRWDAYLTDDEPPELAFYCPSEGRRRLPFRRLSIEGRRVACEANSWRR